MRKAYGSARWPPASKAGRFRSPLRPTTCSFCCVTRSKTISSGATIGSPTSISFFASFRPEEWDWPLFQRLAREHQLDRWIRKALATLQTVTGRPPPSGALRDLGAAPLWRGVLQNREISLRGLPAYSWFDRKARSNGRKARGFVGDAIGPSLKPERAVALALEGQPLTAARIDAPSEVRVSRHDCLSRRLVVA